MPLLHELSNSSPLPTIKEAILSTAKELSLHTAVPRLEAELLLSKVLSRNRTYLIANCKKSLSGKELRSLRRLVKKRKEGVPIAYLLNKKEFYGLEFYVDETVLIPRPETELLVTLTLSILANRTISKPPIVADAGTGSGCIALSLLKELKKQGLKAFVIGIDSSLPALKTAKINRERISFPCSFHLLCSRWLTVLKENSIDIVVSNPPYLTGKEKESCQKELLFEPESALFAEDDEGISAHLALLSEGASVLKKGGYMVLEIGSRRQADLIKERAYAVPLKWSDFKVVKDLSSLPRAVVLKRK